MLTHDILKIKYVELGYIRKNYPYHLLSDKEMFAAFIDLGSDLDTPLVDPAIRFFDRNYPNPFAQQDYAYQKKNPQGEVVEEISLSEEYLKLKYYIVDVIRNHLLHSDMTDAGNYTIPDWVYSYMLGEVIYQKSEYLDIHDTLVLLGCDNLDNTFTQGACAGCYATSLRYVSTLTTGIRPPTVFGEPHVIKSLRMA